MIGEELSWYETYRYILESLLKTNKIRGGGDKIGLRPPASDVAPDQN